MSGSGEGNMGLIVEEISVAILVKNRLKLLAIVCLSSIIFPFTLRVSINVLVPFLLRASLSKDQVFFYVI